jgi:catechol 2,3-dioxygenase-like lactoylglutathione lyase family enzyme
MSAIAIRGFNHSAFIVSDLDRTIGFFCDGLGMTLLDRAPRDGRLIARMAALPGAEVEIAHLQGPGHRIELVRYLAPEGRGEAVPKVTDLGAGHVAFDVPDLAAAVAAAAAWGLVPVGEIVTIDRGPNRGRQVVYLQSPEGLSVEFIGVPA